MKKYKHYSFDLWLTLIKSNPKFKGIRNSLFFDFYNPSNKTIEEVSGIISSVDRMSTQYSELTGRHVQSTHMIFEILTQLNYKIQSMKEVEMIDEAIQGFFTIFLPTVFDGNTLGVLENLARNGKVLNILSNTGFVHGDTLNKVLPTIGLDMFDFKLYSDQLDMAKPNLDFFMAMVSFNSSKAEEILHVGDNPIADGGSRKAGIDFLQINSNARRIIDIL